MSKKEIKGVRGVLGNYTSQDDNQDDNLEPISIPEATPQAPESVVEPPTQPAEPERSEPAPTAKADAKPRAAVGARKGRPLGSKSGEQGLKQKTTLYLPVAATDDYKRWSWADQCSLSELVGRVLLDYHKKRRAKELGEKKTAATPAME